MPQFRCFCLAANDRIEWGLRVEATNLDAAIEAGERACQLHLKTSLPRVEIWWGAKKLYASPSILDFPTLSSIDRPIQVGASSIR
jgi:hypothetical protein